MLRIFVVIGFLVIIGGASAIAFGQSESTPTPAPSKTPITEQTPPPSEGTPEPEATARSSSSEPFTQTDLAVLTGNVQRPNAIQWFGDYLWTSCTGDWTVYRLVDDTGETITYSYGVRMAHTMYAEDDGGINLWIPDYDLDALVLISRQSSPVPVAENLPKPWGIAYLDEENFFITSLSENAIYKVSREGESEVLLDGFRSPTGIVATEDYVYIVNNGSSRRSIEWLDRAKLESKQEQEPQPLLSGVQNATNLVLANDGYLYFTYALGTRGMVGRIDPTTCMEKGGCTNEEFQIVIYTELASPLAGLTISDDMTLYVHTIYRPEIYYVNISGFGE